MMFEINTQCEIEATPEEIWATLIDFDSYSEWNAFIINASRECDNLEITIKPPSEKQNKFTPKIITEVENTELRWAGKFISEYLFRGEHFFKLHCIGQNKTKLIHCEVFTGALTCMITRSQKQHILEGFEAMNKSLQQRVMLNIKSEF